MRFVIAVGVLLLTLWATTVTPWWAQAWISVFWVAFYVGALRSSWRQMIKEAQAAASTHQLRKDADDTTPLNVAEITPPFMGYAAVAIVATVLLTSLLWFVWS